MAWWKTAKPGDKVVCVSKGSGRKPPKWPEDVWVRLVIGSVYTVQYLAAPRESTDCPAFVCLAEFGRRYELDVRGFKPVDPASKKADRGVARLRSFLKDAKQPVSEEV